MKFLHVILKSRALCAKSYSLGFDWASSLFIHLLFVVLTDQVKKKAEFTVTVLTSLVVYWSESLTTNHEVLGSILGSTVGIFLEKEDSHGDHGLGRLVEFRFKAPPGTISSSITTHTSSEQRNCASWASQPQKSVTLLACPGGTVLRLLFLGQHASERLEWWRHTPLSFRKIPFENAIRHF